MQDNTSLRINVRTADSCLKSNRNQWLSHEINRKFRVQRYLKVKVNFHSSLKWYTNVLLDSLYIRAKIALINISTSFVSQTAMMRTRLRSLSSVPEWSDRSWSCFLGLNRYKSYSLTKHLYMNKRVATSLSLATPTAAKDDHPVEIYFVDGLLKNVNMY